MKIKLLIFLLLPLFAASQVVTIDSYNAVIDNSLAVKNNTTFRGGQAFDCNGNYVLDSIKVYFAKTGSPTGNAYINIYNITGTYGTDAVPTGDSLVSSNSIDISTFPTYAGYESFAPFTFTFTNKIILTDNYYAFAICAYGGNTSNYINFGRRATSPTHAGNGVQYTTIWSLSIRDAVFYVYGRKIQNNAFMWHNF